MASRLAIVLGYALAAACQKTKFAGGGSVGSSMGAPPPASFSPPPGGGGAGPLPTQTSGLCGGNFRATRIAFVLDNSGSNGFSDGRVQSPSGTLTGTDPNVLGTSVRGKQENFTQRQNVVYGIISNLVSQNAAAVAHSPGFQGTDVGIASFPKDGSLAGLTATNYVSGPGGAASAVLPALSTNLKSVSWTPAIADALWHSLDFTQKPDGSTPYLVALTEAYAMLKAGRNPGDPRPDYLVVISDGLPTDQQPSQVLAARAALTGTVVIYVSLFKPGADVTLQNSQAYTSLQGAFVNQGWARQPGATDGYAPGGFASYWADLLALPGKIANETIVVQGVNNLSSLLNPAIASISACSAGS